MSSWNSGAERLKGYTPEQALGEHFSIFYSEDDRRNGLLRRRSWPARAEGHARRQAAGSGATGPHSGRLGPAVAGQFRPELITDDPVPEAQRRRTPEEGGAGRPRGTVVVSMFDKRAARRWGLGHHPQPVQPRRSSPAVSRICPGLSETTRSRFMQSHLCAVPRPHGRRTRTHESALQQQRQHSPDGSTVTVVRSTEQADEPGCTSPTRVEESWPKT